MTLPLGRIRGLRACASARGTFAVLALDHRQNLRRELRPDDPAAATHDEMVAFKQAVVRGLDSREPRVARRSAGRTRSRGPGRRP